MGFEDLIGWMAFSHQGIFNATMVGGEIGVALNQMVLGTSQITATFTSCSSSKHDRITMTREIVGTAASQRLSMGILKSTNVKPFELTLHIAIDLTAEITIANSIEFFKGILPI